MAKKRNKVGQVISHEPTAEDRRHVEMLAGIGVPEHMIARVINIDPKTLRKYYSEDIESGAAKATSKVAKRLFDIAMGDSKEALTACIFWLKCRARWSTLDGPETQINVQNNTAIVTARDKHELQDFKRRWEALGSS